MALGFKVSLNFKLAIIRTFSVKLLHCHVLNIDLKHTSIESKNSFPEFTIEIYFISYFRVR